MIGKHEDVPALNPRSRHLPFAQAGSDGFQAGDEGCVASGSLRVRYR
jgi:hypothetical protein